MTEAQPPQVFLSYSRPDRARVAKLAEALEAAGIGVWWDTAIEGGASFSADIERALEAADVVVVAWSAASVKSTWVLDEAGAGRDRGRLVPVQFDATPPPLGFRQFQAIDLSAWKGRAGDAKFAALLSAIQKLAGAAPVTPAPALAAKPGGPSRRLLIGGAVSVTALAAGGFGAWKFMGQKADDGTASVVVLPFANLSGDPAQAFFSDGIAEELRNALSQIPGLKVIGRVSSEKFRNTDDLPAAAEKLNVDHVLTGSVRRSPTTIRIGAQLVDGKTGVESWSQSYDQPVGDSLAIQSKIATSVVAALNAKLGAAAGKIIVGGTSNPAAQELVLKALSLLFGNVGDTAGRQALALADSAIALDPNYGEAWALKAHLISNLEPARLVSEMSAQAMAASQRAVALAPESGFARLALARQFDDRLDSRNALAQGERGVALAPANALVLRDFAMILLSVDPDRSVSLAKAALDLDPLNVLFQFSLAQSLFYARRYSEVPDLVRQADSIGGGQGARSLLVRTLLARKQLQAARKALAEMEQGRSRLGLAAILESQAGDRAASDQALAQFRAFDRQPKNVWLAAIHAQRGETALALAAIETAWRQKEVALSVITVDPLLDPIRHEPRFKAVQDAVIPPDLFVPPKRAATA